ITAIAIMLLAPGIGGAAKNWLRDALTIEQAALGRPDRLVPHFMGLVGGLMLPVLPVIAAAFAACMVGPMLMSGIRFSSKSLQPDFKRLNPASGLKRIYGKEGFAELLRSLLRVLLVVGVGGTVIFGA